MDWNAFLNNMSTNPMAQMGLGMMQAAGPSMQPVGFGQSIASGMQTMAQARHQQQLQEMYQAQMDRMKAKTQQEQEAAAQAQAQAQQDQQAIFGNQASPGGQDSPALQRFKADPMNRVLYHQAPAEFWKQYQAIANPAPAKQDIRQVGHDIVAIGPDMKPHVIYSAPHEASAAEAGPDALLTDDAKSLMAAGLSHGYSIPLPSFGIGAAGAQAKAQALNQLAASIKTSGVQWDDAISNMLQGKTATAGLTDVQKSAAKVNAWENSAAKQADITLGLSNQVDRTGVPLFNKWTLAGRQATGDVDVAKFNNSVATLAEEYARVMGGGNSAATDSTRELAHTMLNSAMTQEQFSGVVDLMKQEMATRKNALSESVDQTRGTIVGKKSSEGGKYHVGQVINVGGKQYKVTGGDPNDPDLEAL